MILLRLIILLYHDRKPHARVQHSPDGSADPFFEEKKLPLAAQGNLNRNAASGRVGRIVVRNRDSRDQEQRAAMPPDGPSVAQNPKLKLGHDSPEQPETHLIVIARQRDHETHPAVARGVGIARERADSLHRTGLVHAAVMAVEQVGVGR